MATLSKGVKQIGRGKPVKTKLPVQCLAWGYKCNQSIADSFTSIFGNARDACESPTLYEFKYFLCIFGKTLQFPKRYSFNEQQKLTY